MSDQDAQADSTLPADLPPQDRQDLPPESSPQEPFLRESPIQEEPPEKLPENSPENSPENADTPPPPGDPSPPRKIGHSTKPEGKTIGSGERPPETKEEDDEGEAGAQSDRREANNGDAAEVNDSSSGGRQKREGEPRKSRKERYREKKEKDRARQAAALESAPAVESEGLVEISPKGFGFLRDKGRGFQQAPKDDVFITPEIVRKHDLRDGLWVKCVSKQGVRGPQLTELLSVNGKDPEEYQNLPYFEELTAINPNKAYKLETVPTRNTTRVIDMLAPVGRGQRGLIVAPPRTGKTTLLHHMADAIQENYEDEVHLMVLLVDERPEEVTDFQRSFPQAEIFSSSNDSSAKDHTRLALLAIERAKRLVEAGEHVFILMDSITRLARAFNSSMRGGKRGTASGGLTVGALEAPRRIFAAARNTREAGSLTIIATALIQTNSKADEAIFQEFKGTGNMELVLDRQIAQNYVYPAVDIHKSGTRREELLFPPRVLEKIHVLRRGLGGYKPVDAMEWLNKAMEKFDSNAQMLMEMKLSAVS